MAAENQKHPTLDNKITVNLPQDRHISIHDTLNCKDGILNNIHVKNHNEGIEL
jgi:hypothetical protein